VLSSILVGLQQSLAFSRLFNLSLNLSLMNLPSSVFLISIFFSISLPSESSLSSSYLSFIIPNYPYLFAPEANISPALDINN